MGAPHAVGQQLPHGREGAGQGRQRAQVGVRFVGAVEVAAARGGQAELLRHGRVGAVFGRRVAARDHLDALAAVLAEFGKQRVFLGGGELVARRVRDHGHAAGLRDPAHRVAQRGPAVRHVAGLAFGEEAAEYLGRIAAHACLDEEAREMRAGDEFGIAHVAQRAFVGIADADPRELLRHLPRALAAAAARVGQAPHQLRVVRVEAEPDDVHRGADEGHRDLHAGEVVHALRGRCGHGAVLAAHFVVVGQGPQLDAVGARPLRQCLGRERAVGHHGVAMEVGVQSGRHGIIVGPRFRVWIRIPLKMPGTEGPWTAPAPRMPASCPAPARHSPW